MNYLIIYIITINILSFVMFGIDKWKAKKRKYRISEKTLLSVAIIGGGIGALIAMYIFHHKTKHPKFYVGIPIFMCVQVVTIIICFN